MENRTSSDADSRRIRARIRIGFAWIRGDSPGFAVVFGRGDKNITQKIIWILTLSQKAAQKKEISNPPVLTLL